MARQKNSDVLGFWYHRVDTASRGEAMADRDLKATDPAAHQPTKDNLEEDVSIEAATGALAWAITRGGAERQHGDEES